MELDRERPWRRNAPNELIVNSILAAVSAIVVQTIVTSKHDYGAGWLITATASIFLFVVSAEQLGESIREDDIDIWLRSLNLYNVGVLLLFLSFASIVNRYTALDAPWWSLVLIAAILWTPVWGRDAMFLLFKGDHFDRWKRKMNGEIIEGAILDPYEVFMAQVIRWSRRRQR